MHGNAVILTGSRYEDTAQDNWMRRIRSLKRERQRKIQEFGTELTSKTLRR